MGAGAISQTSQDPDGKPEVISNLGRKPSLTPSFTVYTLQHHNLTDRRQRWIKLEVVAIHFMIVAMYSIEATQVDDDGILCPPVIILDGRGHHPPS